MTRAWPTTGVRKHDATVRGVFGRIASQLWAPAALGQILVVLLGLVTAATLALFHPTQHTWNVAMADWIVMLATLLAAQMMPWPRLSPYWYLIFPISILVEVAALGQTGVAVGSNYTGFFVLSFAYIGFSQPPWTSAKILPFAVAAWICANGSWQSTLIPRLFIAVIIWVLLGEFLARLTSRQSALSERLRQAAYTDALTGVSNRRDFDRQMLTVQPGLAVVICDLDSFKQVNDTLGHAAGDQVLVDFGFLLRSSLRAGDYAARYGGEEFALLLPDTTLEQTSLVLERLRMRWRLLRPHVTFSSGVAICGLEMSATETLLAADRSLYGAKANGRNRDYCQAGDLSTVSTHG